MSGGSGGGLASFLAAELASLSAEARRRWPDVREATDRAIAFVKQRQQASPVDFARELAATEDVVRPLLMACNTRTAKPITIAVGCIQRLIAQEAVPMSLLGNVLATLGETLSQGPEIQLRVLQSVFPLLNNYPRLHGELLAESLLLCFRLQESKTSSVNHTAAGTLRQMTVFLFEKAAKEEKEPVGVENDEYAQDAAFVRRYAAILPQVANLKPCALDAFLLFQDLCLLTNGDKPVFLRLEYLNRTFGLELIESVLSAHHTIFTKIPEFTALLKDRVCPMVLKIVAMKNPFPQVIRLMRVIYVLIKFFSAILVVECELFVGTITGVLQSDNPYWQKVLCMEIIRGICLDGELLRSINRNYDNVEGVQNIFCDIVALLAKMTGFKLPSGGNDAVLSVASTAVKIQCIDQLDKFDPPQLPEQYLTFLILTSINHIAENIAALVLPLYLSVGTSSSNSSVGAPLHPYSPSQSIQTSLLGTVFTITPIDVSSMRQQRHPKYDAIALSAKMILSCATGMLDAFNNFWVSRLDADLFHSMMKAMQNFVLSAGVFGLRGPRDAFIVFLCKHSFATQEPVVAPPEPAPSTVSSFVPDFSGLFSSSSAATIATTATASPSASVITVTAKSSAAFRVLLNVSHILASALEDDAWVEILETFRQMDAIIHGRGEIIIGSKKVDTAAPSSSSDESSSSALLAGMQQIFDSSKWLSDSAFCCFARALTAVGAQSCGVPHLPWHLDRQLSDVDKNGLGSIGEELSMGMTMTETMPSDTSSPLALSPVRPSSGVWTSNYVQRPDEVSFILEKLRDVLLINIRRILREDLTSTDRLTETWNSVIKFLLGITSAPYSFPILKGQACDAICRVVLAVLTYVVTAKKTEEHSSAVVHISDDVQRRILLPLKDLVVSGNVLDESVVERSRGDPPIAPSHQRAQMQLDVHKSGLEALNRLLQTGGQYLTSVGYAIIFDIFEEACNWQDRVELIHDERSVGDLPLIRIAFPSLHLICMDFSQALSAENMHKCIETIGSFASQMDDINISLTSINLLWTLSDTARNLKPEVGGNGDTADHLWFTFLKQLAASCVDFRSEVRNTATQTLFRMISMTYGEHWSGADWERVILEIVFPMIHLLRVESGKNQRTILKTERFFVSVANPTPVNPLQLSPIPPANKLSSIKQWDETKILALNALAHMLLQYFVKLVKIPSFVSTEDRSKSLWNRFLRIFYLEFCGLDVEEAGDEVLVPQAHEVSIASIRAFRRLLGWASDHQADLKPNIGLAETVTGLWRDALLVWEEMALSALQRKRAFCWCFGPNAPVAVDPDPSRKSIMDLMFRNETLIAHSMCFPLIWQVVRPSLDNGRHRFHLEDFRRWGLVARGMLTFYDLSYFVSHPKLAEPIAVDISTVRVALLTDYNKIHASDSESMTVLQLNYAELLLGPAIVRLVREETAPQDPMLTPPYAKDDEKMELTEPSIWESILLADGEPNGAFACSFLEELSVWTSLAFRRSHHMMNVKSFVREGGSTVLLSTKSPLAMSNSLLSNRVELTPPASPTKSSAPSMVGVNATEIQTQSGIKAPTFVALCNLLMRSTVTVFEQTLRWNDQKFTLSRLPEVYESGTVRMLLETFSVPMSLKYDCCSVVSAKKAKDGVRDHAVRLWKLSTDIFFSISRLALVAMRETKAEQESVAEIWKGIIHGLDGAILSQSLPPPEMSLEDFDADEEYEMGMLRRFTSELLPFAGSQDENAACEHNTLDKFLRILSSCSKLWNDKSRNVGGRADVLVSTMASVPVGGALPLSTSNITVVPVVRERLAKACLDLLFRLCDRSAEFGECPAEVLARVASLASPILLERCWNCLETWTHDKPLYGVCPFPRIRNEEMVLVLQHLLALRLRSSGVEALVQRYGSPCQAWNPLAAGEEDSVHIFYLYRCLLGCIPHCGPSDAAAVSRLEEDGEEETPVRVGELLLACLERTADTFGFPKTLQK